MKTLYRRGVAHAELNNYEDALDDLNNVLDLEPTNKAAAQRLKVIRSNLISHTIFVIPLLDIES